MKTAISVPDATFDRVNRRAQQLGMSRSEFFVTAAIHYIEALDAASLTERINAALAAATDEETERVVVAAGHPRLLDENEDW